MFVNDSYLIEEKVAIALSLREIMENYEKLISSNNSRIYSFYTVRKIKFKKIT